jgi:hypothetical protein
MLWPLVIVLVVFALGGFYGGIMMLRDPSGELFQVADILPLLPVANFILPGLFLIVVMGFYPLLLAIALVIRPDWPWLDSLVQWSKHYWAWTGTLILVAVLTLWLIYEIWLIGIFPITYATAVMGLLILIFALMPGVRRYFTIDFQPAQ